MFTAVASHYSPLSFDTLHIHPKKNYKGVVRSHFFRDDSESLGTFFSLFLRQQCGLIILDAATVEDDDSVALKLKDPNAQRHCVTSKN